MLVDELADPLALFSVAAGVALLGVLGRRRLLLRVGKPLATLALVGVAWPGRLTLTAALGIMGILISVAGDTALLFEGAGPFLLGLFLFLFVHLAYTAAFLLGGVGPAWTPLVGILIFGGASGWLVRKLWPGVPKAMRPPLVVYAASLTAMVAAAFSTLTGRWPPEAAAAAAVGSLLFFFSDANLAWARYVEAYPPSQAITLVLYWAGQLGVALAVRWAGS
jgi:uncharacterized membrane protein YhhN